MMNPTTFSNPENDVKNGSQNGLQNDLHFEKIFVNGAFWRFFIPSICSSLGLAIGGLADCLFVGSKMGSDGLTAISLGIPVYLFYNILSYGFSVGGSIHYAQYLGVGKPEEANKLFGNVLRFLLFIYIITAALGILFLPELLGVLGVKPTSLSVYSITYRYVRAQLICIPILFCQGPFYYFVLSDGAPKRAAVALTVSNSIDILLNYVFVVRLNMGAEGSVWSTAIGAVFCLLICDQHMILHHGVLRFSWPKFDLPMLKESIHTGLPTVAQYIYQFIAVLVSNMLLLSTTGSVGVAVFDVVYNLSLLSSAISDGTGMAIQPMLSTYHAEHNADASRLTLKKAGNIVLILSLFTSALLAFCAVPLCHLFKLSGTSFYIGITAIWIFCISILPSVYNQVAIYYLQATGMEKRSFLIQTMRQFVFFLIFAIVFSLFRGNAFWWTFPVSEISALFIVIYTMRQIAVNYQMHLLSPEYHYSYFWIQDKDSIAPSIENLQHTCEGWDCSPKQSYIIPLVCEEISTAILEDAVHQNKADILIKITVVMDADGVTLHILDNSIEFDPFHQKDENNIANELGMSIVKQQAKDFFYRRYQGYNNLIIIL